MPQPPGTLTLSPSGARDTWSDDVARAAAQWSTALEPSCGIPSFELGVDSHPVILVPAHEWTNPKLAGSCDGWRIIIRDGMSADHEHRVLLHELGHLMGAGHVEGRLSIMNPAPGKLTDEDVELLADVAGCIP